MVGAILYHIHTGIIIYSVLLRSFEDCVYIQRVIVCKHTCPQTWQAAHMAHMCIPYMAHNVSYSVTMPLSCELLIILNNNIGVR